MKAVIYCRVSSRAQEQDGHGLTSQETRCREHAAAKGYDVAAVFPDTITGGGDFMKRPGMVALLSYHETFDKVQARRTQSAKLPMRKNIGDDFALRGFVECGGCNAPLRSSWSKGKAKHYAYYLCQTKGCDDYGKSIPRDKIEGDVGAIIKQLAVIFQ